MIHRLSCKSQSYDWGKLGKSSKVAQLQKEYKDNTPYAELWMGTHPNGPSFLKGTDKSLLSILTPEILGSEVSEKYSNDLPFLFKVLSIRKALSIQAHPDKKLAQELYNKRPDLYKDGNHKPEMAIGLTKFEALVGFRQISEIQENLHRFPEFSRILDPKVVEEFKKLNDSDAECERKEKLKKLFSNLMHSNEELVKSGLSEMISRIKGSDKNLEILLNRVYEQYPGDIGVFCLLFLNYVSLESGQAIFLAANEPHAYLSGDCIECMATSDNVVRSGLTPKFKDVETLVSMLTYNHGPVEKLVLSGSKFGKHSLLYDPPIAEFAVVKTSLKTGEVEEMKGFKGPSILLVTQGSGTMNQDSVEEGDVFFIAAGTLISIESSVGLTVYRAFCE